MKQVFAIPVVFPDLNSIIKNSKTHWSRYSNPKKGYDAIVAAYARQKLEPVSKPIDIHCHWVCKDKRKDKLMFKSQQQQIEELLQRNNKLEKEKENLTRQLGTTGIGISDFGMRN